MSQSGSASSTQNQKEGGNMDQISMYPKPKSKPRKKSIQSSAFDTSKSKMSETDKALLKAHEQLPEGLKFGVGARKESNQIGLFAPKQETLFS